MEPPEKSRRDRLALLGADVDLAPVDGSASHPFLCRQKTTEALLLGHVLRLHRGVQEQLASDQMPSKHPWDQRLCWRVNR